MSALENYSQTVQNQLSEIHRNQRANLEQAADWVASALMQEKFIYTFGSGHSHTLAEEMFYRAGGLARSIPILDENLMVHKSASASTDWERKEGYAAEILKRYSLGSGDVLFVVSNSGRNAVPIEMAMEANKHGAKVIAITSTKHGGTFASRHSLGKKLSDVAHLVIDNCSEAGDAAVAISGSSQKVGPTSTITSAFILNSIVAEAVARAAVAGKPPEVYPSINTDSGELTRTLTEKYRGAIPHL
jgi:uncharacterized phosphosugar-binding protein